MARRFDDEYLQSAESNRSSSSIPNGSENSLVSPYPPQMVYTPVGNPQGQNDIPGGDYNRYATRYPPMVDTPRGMPLVPREIYDGQETKDNLPMMGSHQLSHGNVQGYSGGPNFEGGNNIPQMVSLANGPNINSGVYRNLNPAAIGNSEFPGTMHGNESLHETSQQSYNAQPTAINSGGYYMPYYPQHQLPPPPQTNVQNTGVPIARSFHPNSSRSYEMNPYDKNAQPYIERQNQPRSRVVGGPVRENRFGIAHLVNVNKDPALRYLSMGVDLTTLGVDVTSKEPVSAKFASPWSDEPVKEEPVFSIPDCYTGNQMPPLKKSQFEKMPEQTLLYIFYSMPQDEAQLYAANEMCNRGWHYHKELQTWLRRVPNKVPLVKTTTYEKSDYICFDIGKFAMVLKENFVLHYEMIEKRPELPQ